MIFETPRRVKALALDPRPSALYLQEIRKEKIELEAKSKTLASEVSDLEDKVNSLEGTTKEMQV